MDDAPDYNVIDGINFRTGAKRFTYKAMQKTNIILFFLV